MIVCVVYIYLFIYLFKRILEGAALTAVFDSTSLRIAPFVVCRVFFCTLFPFLFLGLKLRRMRAQGTMIGQGKDMMYGQGTGGGSRNGCSDC